MALQAIHQYDRTASTFKDGANKSLANLATLSSKTGASHIVPWQLIVRGDKDRIPFTRRVKVICSRQTTSYLRSGVCILGDFMDSMTWYQIIVKG